MAEILILAVDEEIRRTLFEWLTESGYRTFEALALDEAVERYRELGDPVVLLHADGSPFDALEAIQALKRTATRPRILALSAASSKQRLLLAAGATRCVIHDRDALMSALESVGHFD